MNFDIFKTNTNFAIGSVRTNHCDSSEIFMLGSLDELENLSITRDKDIALIEFFIICLNHIPTR